MPQWNSTRRPWSPPIGSSATWPGPSSGLAIAERFQMPREVLALARDSLDRSELEAARYVDDLRARIGSLESEKAELEAEKNEFEAWKGTMARQLEDERADELDRVGKKLDSIVKEIRDSGGRRAEGPRQGRGEAGSDRKLENARARASLEIRRERSKTISGQDHQFHPAPGID